MFILFYYSIIEWQEDAGEIREKEYLPVKAVRFGDTGTPLDEKQGRYTLGALMCEGDDLFNNMVTFRVTDATIELPHFDMGHSGDIYFEFKTTTENAVLFHATVSKLAFPSDIFDNQYTFLEISGTNGLYKTEYYQWKEIAIPISSRQRSARCERRDQLPLER